LIALGVVLRVVALFTAYFAGAAFGITLTQHAGDVVPFWPPDALLLAVLLRSDPHRWPVWLATAMLAAFAADMLLVGDLALGVVLGAANMVGVITSAGLLRRFTAGYRIALEDGRHLIAFAVCGGILGPVIGATCATGWFVISAGLDFWPVWITWWIADAMGVLLFGPLFLSVTREALKRFATVGSRVELAAIVVISTAAAYIRYAQVAYPLGFLIVPILLWAAFRLRIFGCSLGAAIYATITAWSTVRGYGRMARIEALDPTGSRAVFADGARGYAQGLKDSEIRLRAIVDHAHDAYVAIDRDGRIVTWSAEAERTFGWSASEVLGRQLSETIIPPRYREDHRRGLRRYLETGEERVFDRLLQLEALHRDGSEFPVELSIATFEIGNGRFFGAFIRDVTERRRLEERLRETQNLEAIGRLAGGIAHTFNNLFQVMFGNLHLAERRTDDDGARASLAKVVHAAERGALVTRQLLAFAREQTLSPQWVEPSDQLREAVSFITQSLAGDVVVRTDIPARLWLLQIDLSELQLALVNLALNARDAMPTGGTIEITAMNETLSVPHLGLDGEYLVIKVADTGAGISPEVLSRVFDPFFTTKDPAVNRGLGLSQVHGFAYQSGGAVEIRSELGEGTIVTLFLPSSQNMRLANAPSDDTHSEAAHKAGTVLLVEDDLDVAEVTAALLEECGYAVKLTYRSSEALNVLLQGKRVDLVLSDIMMPGGMNGMQLAEEVRSLLPELPVLLATGYSDAAADAVSRGLPIITKPYTMEELCASVSELIAPRLSDGQPA
jgi:PAS domain S-box-containing protein